MGWGIGSIGSILNDVTGVTSGARQSQKYALQSGAINNAYQKEFAQNAHQWEMQDFRNAGLNPVLSAGGSGTGASGGGVSAGTAASSGINPIETAIGAWNGIEQAQNTGADTKRKNAETLNTEADTLLKQADTDLKQVQYLKIQYENANTQEEKKEIMARIRLLNKQHEETEEKIKLLQRTSGPTSHKGGNINIPTIELGGSFDKGIYGRIGGKVGVEWDS